MKASIEDAANIVENRNRCIRWEMREEALYQHNAILLLFARHINVGQEKHNIMVTHKCHQPSIVKLGPMHLFLLLICSFVRLFTFIDC